LLVGDVGRPAVGGENGSVQLAVGQVEPGGPLVVEIGQRPLLEAGADPGEFVSPVKKTGWLSGPTVSPADPGELASPVKKIGDHVVPPAGRIW
jgi:hypothetical protein